MAAILFTERQSIAALHGNAALPHNLSKKQWPYDMGVDIIRRVTAYEACQSLKFTTQSEAAVQRQHHGRPPLAEGRGYLMNSNASDSTCQIKYELAQSNMSRLILSTAF